MMGPAPSTIASAFSRLIADLDEDLRAVAAQDLRRRLTTIEAVHGPVVRIDGREVVCWCSNDYLGLSQHPALACAATSAAEVWGVGSRASRLLAGTTRAHRELEEVLAAWFGAEDAAVFASGYLTNLGVLGALVSSKDLVVIDRFAHASLFDAVRASRATLRVFHHNDASHAAKLLSRANGVRRRFLVTEGVFSMDGDRAPLGALVDVARMSEAVLYLDDAHGAFVLGATGRGSPEAAGLVHEDFLYIGTLGKALGCQGGFVVGPRTLIAALHNRARTFLYATALAPPIVAAAREALCLLEEEPQWRAQLAARSRLLYERLGAIGIAPTAGPSHIIPIIIGASGTALQVARHLEERGIWAPAIRPPAVPDGTARLRLSITALHTSAHIHALAEALHDGLRALAPAHRSRSSGER